MYKFCCYDNDISRKPVGGKICTTLSIVFKQRNTMFLKGRIQDNIHVHVHLYSVAMLVP